MNESSAVRASSWASTSHTPGPIRRGGLPDHGVLAGQACVLHPHPGQPDVDDIGMRWAIAWYRNIQSRTSRLGDGHVAA
jgi:hypothetical protein